MAQALTQIADSMASSPTDNLAMIRDIARGVQHDTSNEDEDRPGIDMEEIPPPSCLDTRDGLDLIMSSYPLDDGPTAPTAKSADTGSASGATAANTEPRQ